MLSLLAALLITQYQYYGLAPGPAIILNLGALYLLSLFFGAQGGYLWKLLPQKHLEA